MAGDSIPGKRGIMIDQGHDQTAELGVLPSCKPCIVGAFEFDSDRIIVAIPASFIAGVSGMPGPAIEGHVLSHRPGPSDQQVSGDLHLTNGLKIRVLFGNQLILKQPVDMVAPEYPGR